MAESGLPSGVRRRGRKFIAKPYINGEHHWGGTFETVEEAADRVREMKAEMRIAPANKETINEAADRWLKEIEATKKPATVENYKGALKRFREVFGKRRPREVTRGEARAHVIDRQTDRHGLSSFYGWLMVQDIVAVNPFSKLKLPGSKGRKDLEVLTADELAVLESCALQAHAERPALAVAMEAFIGFMAGSMMRTSEVLGLNHEFLDFEESLILVAWQDYKRQRIRPKNGETREIYFTERAKAAVRKVPASTATDAVFHVEGRRITQSQLSIAWKPIRILFESRLDPARRMKLAESRPKGQPHLVPYELRHFGATDLMEEFAQRGMDGAPHVAHQLGHTDGGVLVRGLYGRHHQERFHRERISDVLGSHNDRKERKAA